MTCGKAEEAGQGRVTTGVWSCEPGVQLLLALIIREGLVSRDSNNWIWQKSLLGVQEAYAGALKAGRKLDDAIQQYRRALATGEKLASREPGNAAWQARLQAVRKDLEAAMIAQRKSAEQDR